MIRIAVLAVNYIALAAGCICNRMLCAINTIDTCPVMEHMTHTKIMVCTEILLAVLAVHKIACAVAVVSSTVSGYKVMYA